MRLVNPDLDVDAARAAYVRAGFVILRDFLAPETAEVLAETLEAKLPWELWSRGPEGTVVVAPDRWARMDPRARAALVPPPPASVEAFHYAYERVAPRGDEADPNLRALAAFREALNGRPYLELLGRITGTNTGTRVEGAWSRYGPGHFLSPHTDANRDQVRLAAQVLGLTRDWASGWGGHLSLCTPEGDREALVPPSFNTLVLFSVPRWHFVSPVRTQARRGRHSFFGWLVERDLEAGSGDPTRVIA